MIEDRRRPIAQETAGGMHQFTLSGRQHLTLEGAKNVVSFSSEEILLETSAGGLAIKGEDLHIQQLNLDDGRMVVEGTFATLAYLGEGVGKKSRNFLNRLLR